MRVLEMLSNQCQTYYECLIEGKVVLPSHPAALYTAILRGEEEVANGMVPAERKRRVPEPAALPLSDDEILEVRWNFQRVCFGACHV